MLKEILRPRGCGISQVLNVGNYDAVLTSLPRQLHTLKTPAKKPGFDMTSTTLAGLKAYAPHRSAEPMKPFEWKVYKKLKQVQLPSFPHIDTFETHKSNSSLKPITVELQ